MITDSYCRFLLGMIKQATHRDPWIIREIAQLANQLKYHPDPALERWFCILFGAAHAKWGS